MDGDGAKYRYTKGATRKPYLWDIALERAERQGYLALCEGELDGLSLLSALGADAPVASMGGVGAIGAVANDPRLAGLDIIYIADLEAPPRYGTEHEEADLKKHRNIELVVAQSLWKLRQLNANVTLVYPPSINPEGKTDVNDLLLAYGAEGLLEWVIPEIDRGMKQATSRSLI
jgi:hypothetical protein